MSWPVGELTYRELACRRIVRIPTEGPVPWRWRRDGPAGFLMVVNGALQRVSNTQDPAALPHLLGNRRWWSRLPPVSGSVDPPTIWSWGQKLHMTLINKITFALCLITSAFVILHLCPSPLCINNQHDCNWWGENQRIMSYNKIWCLT